MNQVHGIYIYKAFLKIRGYIHFKQLQYKTRGVEKNEGTFQHQLIAAESNLFGESPTFPSRVVCWYVCT